MIDANEERAGDYLVLQLHFGGIGPWDRSVENLHLVPEVVITLDLGEREISGESIGNPNGPLLEFFLALLPGLVEELELDVVFVTTMFGNVVLANGDNRRLREGLGLVTGGDDLLLPTARQDVHSVLGDILGILARGHLLSFRE